MMTLYIMCGLPFSGKTTLARVIARKTNSGLISFDLIYLEKRPEFNDKISWTDQQKIVHKTAFERIKDMMRKGESVVYDDTNLRLVQRRELNELAEEFKAKSVIVFMDTPIEIIKDRERAACDKGERFSTGKETLERVFKDFQPPQPDENAVVYTPEMVTLEDRKLCV